VGCGLALESQTNGGTVAKRSYNFEETETPNGKAVREAAVIQKKEKMAAQAEKLLAAEKRWLRKSKLAGTKIKKIRAAFRRLQKRRDALG
jgi:hypothetical protein